MPVMHIAEDLNDRMFALGYTKRVQRIVFVKEAIRERLEREESEAGAMNPRKIRR